MRELTNCCDMGCRNNIRRITRAENRCLYANACLIALTILHMAVGGVGAADGMLNFSPPDTVAPTEVELVTIPTTVVNRSSVGVIEDPISTSAPVSISSPPHVVDDVTITVPTPSNEFNLTVAVESTSISMTSSVVNSTLSLPTNKILSAVGTVANDSSTRSYVAGNMSTVVSTTVGTDSSSHSLANIGNDSTIGSVANSAGSLWMSSTTETVLSSDSLTSDGVKSIITTSKTSDSIGTSSPDGKATSANITASIPGAEGLPTLSTAGDNSTSTTNGSSKLPLVWTTLTSLNSSNVDAATSTPVNSNSSAYSNNEIFVVHSSTVAATGSNQSFSTVSSTATSGYENTVSMVTQSNIAFNESSGGNITMPPMSQNSSTSWTTNSTYYTTTVSPHLNPCMPNPCSNNATCRLDPGNSSKPFVCSCLLGFSGELCEIYVDACVQNNCTDRQVCVSGNGSYTCRCLEGYKGTDCQIDVDECASNPCKNGGTCIDHVNRYECQCVQQFVNLTSITFDSRSVYVVGYEGANCEQFINPCDKTPSICLNDGLCRPYNGSWGFRCYCPSGGNYFTGRYCELRKTYCDVIYQLDSSPVCANGGTCVDIGDGYVCNCLAGFTGTNCSTNINECESNPCPLNGTCIDLIDGYKCTCSLNSTVVNCDCLSGPCKNGGRCIDGPRRYQCDCSNTGYKGEYCDIEINECDSSPCQHGATCIDHLKNYTCQCYDGYVGVNCEQDINECLSSPCQHNSTCVERSLNPYLVSYANASGYDCVCAEGYTGVHCQTDINECSSFPCLNNATCLDLVGSFDCRCAAGFRGALCEIEINECAELSPCSNNATCIDLVADYQCICDSPLSSSVSGTTVYGGRNCSVELVGCHGNTCSNGATCRPLLINEITNNHTYICDCVSGYYGDRCQIATAVSFLDREAWIQYGDAVDLETLHVSLQFRTTVPDGVLMLVQLDPLSDNRSLIVTLSGGRQLQLVHYQQSVVKQMTQVSPPLYSVLNDANWYGVDLFISKTKVISVQLSHPNCSTSCISSFANINSSAVGAISIGRAMSVWSGFVGCMRDVHVGSIWLTPGWLLSNNESAKNVAGYCVRSDQCATALCGRNGQCVDLWNTFSCVCQRPFFGLTCTEVVTPATFGKDGITTSYAMFRLPPTLQQNLEYILDVSFFLRTRKPAGVVLYVGSDITLPDYNRTYVIVELMGSGLKTTVRSGSLMQSFDTTAQIADGYQHFIEVVRNYSALSVRVDNNFMSYDVDVRFELIADLLFVGGTPSTLPMYRRQKRDTMAQNTFSGTMQDVRVNGVLLELFSQNVSGVTLLPELLSNVSSGEQSSDVCGMLKPCQNNGTCINTFYDDYRCRCTEAFKGRNCTEKSYCFINPCPADSQCFALDDGFECAAKANFNGLSSNIQYSYTSSLLSSSAVSLSFGLRTRLSNASLMTITSSSSLNRFMKVMLSNGTIVLRLNQSGLSEYTNTFKVNDGNWHLISINVFSTLVSLSVDGSVKNSSATNLETIGQFFNASAHVSVGGAANDNLFKGCLDSLRINNLLLPFANELTNVTSNDRFVITANNSVDIGCRGDDVCRQPVCRNNGSCIDIWNDFVCQCARGFNGSFCEMNINDCTTGNECLNNGTCVDGIADYSCLCLPGYTDKRCETDIDECLSNPCRHNGSCVDRVNGYNCSCTNQFTGPNCEIDLHANCDTNPCQNNATCIRVPVAYPGYPNIETYNCSCTPGFSGEHCEHLIDPCAVNGCLHSSTCEPDFNTFTYKCVCPAGYNGTLCETDVNECASSPCRNGGSCINLIGGFNCTCDSGFTGERCDTDINECEVSTMCLNGGLCQNTNGSYYCACAPGYAGKDCSCGPANCSSHGGCLQVPTADGHELYTCYCYSNRTGTNCESDLVSDTDSLLSPASIGLIVGIIVGVCLLVLIIVAIILGVMAKKKRATHGTYSPSRQEMAGSRIDFGSTFKVPPEERLI